MRNKIGERELLNSYKNSPTDNLLEENNSLLKKLGKVAKKQKTHIESELQNNGSYSSYIPDENRKIILKNIKSSKKKVKGYLKRRGSETTTPREKAQAYRNVNRLKRFLKSKDDIVLGLSPNSNKPNASVLSHELGHSQHYYGRGGSKVGKLAHRVRDFQKNAINKVSEMAEKRGIKINNSTANKSTGVVAGLASGINAGKKEKEGKKEGFLSKTAWITTPTVAMAPTLISEGEATRQGLKILRKAGASKAYMGMARKNLGHAFGTYATGLIAPIAMGYGARQIGKVIGRRIAKNKGPKNSGENNEKRV